MKFIKTFFSIIGAHLALCLVPIILSPILNDNPSYNVSGAQGVGQKVLFIIFALVLFAAYIFVGRVVKSKGGSRLGVVLSSAVIFLIGMAVYVFVFISKTENPAGMIFAMPQIIMMRAIYRYMIAYAWSSVIGMALPFVGILIGYFTKKE